VEEMNMPNIDDLIQAAKKEEWDVVDKDIPNLCKDPSVQERAIELLKDTDGNVRDLGASILGKPKINSKIFLRAKPILRDVMTGDENQYARYRAAFALAEHGGYKAQVMRVLQEASEDKDVGDIARKYLEKLR
jgi:HEAT repeat protein